MKKKVIIMGAAGRDFHNFNILFRDNPGCEVVAFTATQIPFIVGRTYPPELSGKLYPKGIRIYDENELPGLLKSFKPDEVVFSYSDVSNDYIMERCSLVTTHNADFVLLGAEKTMLKSARPVISVSAVRTGSGKSEVTRFAGKTIKEAGKRPIAIRHPMPYGDLTRQKVQRFEKLSDMRSARCTIEEMEEYEPLIDAGLIVYAGVDYGEILKSAEAEADIIIWDGGNNDLPFVKPDLAITVADPFRPGHELKYYHGEANIRLADYVIINKADTAREEDIERVEKNVKSINPSAKSIRTASHVEADCRLKGKRALVIEDGPTLTHGGMSLGAGIIAARNCGAIPVDVRPYAVGTIKDTLDKYPALDNLLPAMGYSESQIKELEETINKTPCDAVLTATPVNLENIIKINKPTIRVAYGIKDIETPGLKDIIMEFLKRMP